MKNSKIVRTDQELRLFIADPKGKVKGNKTAYFGLKKPGDVANLVAYLRTLK